MIVDFVSIKERLERIATLRLRREIEKRTPILSMIGKHLLHEGSKYSFETVDHEKREMKFQKAETTITLSRQEMGRISHQEIMAKIETSAEEMARQMERGTLQTLSEELERVGNTISGGGKPFSPETILQGLQMIQIDFEDDSRDKPQLPTWVISLELAAKTKIQEAAMAEEEKAEFEVKFQAILDQKYEEFLVREGTRKLID